MDTKFEAKIGQTRPRLGSDRRVEIGGLLDGAHRLPEAGWRRVLTLWGYAGTPPFFAAFRDRQVR